MQKELLSIAYTSLKSAYVALEAVKTADIKARKAAKPSAKSKWTKRIDATTRQLKVLTKAKSDCRSLPRRVA